MVDFEQITKGKSAVSKPQQKATVKPNQFSRISKKQTKNNTKRSEKKKWLGK